jgi:hypothetical protein
LGLLASAGVPDQTKADLGERWIRIAGEAVQLVAILTPDSLAAPAFEHANGQASARVHHFVREFRLRAALTTAVLMGLRALEFFAAEVVHGDDSRDAEILKYETALKFPIRLDKIKATRPRFLSAEIEAWLPQPDLQERSGA